MITEITMKNVATYNQVGVKIEGLKRLNYFFGNNGSGKSTIAKYLQSLVIDDPENKYSSCLKDNYNPMQEEILVFNQDFVERNFRQSQTLKGVFSLNQKNAEIDKQIKVNEEAITNKLKTKNELEERNDILDKQKIQHRKELTDKCFGKRKIFSSFLRIQLDHKGSAKNNLEKLETIIQNNSIVKPEFRTLNDLYKKLYEDNLSNIDISLDIQLFDELLQKHNELSVLLQEVIVGKEDVQLAKLINEFGLKSWVAQGKVFLEKTKVVCPFCQKETIDDDFISQLNDIFDESSKQKIDKIKSEKIIYENTFKRVLQNIQAVYEKYNVKNIVSNLQMSLKTIYDTNLKIISDKINAPNERKTLGDITESFKDILLKINKEIENNNNLVSSLDTQKKSLGKQIWDYIALDCKDDILKSQKDVEETNGIITKNKAEIEKLLTEMQQLQQENTALRGKTVNTTEAVYNINQILKNSGFMGFEINEQNKENNISRYYLSRNSEVLEENIFNSLSEGESNFISFLYFYQLCLGTTDIQGSSEKKKIIVIDDPVSSMDSQVLFIVSTLINRLIEYKGKTEKQVFLNGNFEQVFILTHNYYFYKEVAMQKRPICKSQQHYLVEKSEINETYIKQREYKECDDYALMWQTIKEAKGKLPDANKEQNILLANLFRRILESYANFIGLGTDAWATVLVDDNKDTIDHYLKVAFISMINDESHKVSPFDNFYFQKIHNANPSKLFEVFESIFNTIGKEHYDRMMETNKL
ncbi:AAA family ATPase [Treponema sp. Marseille-Q4130]|uniref:AAA family ATPase n=1 Tax=Treponema sp. Marseille-Q4130 TaxID=2766702 RepID=UPI001652943B|nr:AAA family ATPase [Treponema sp. Marseille-Q4130]MBC6719951.1 AAA family ATPase [Treponema sp. Marseille-Q4130]